MKVKKYIQRKISDSTARQAVCSVPRSLGVNRLCPDLDHRVTGRRGQLPYRRVPEKTSRLAQVSLNSPCTLLYTHTYCPAVSAATDWGLTIHRKVNKLLSVLCRGPHCPLAAHPTTMLHITLTKALDYCNFPKPQSWIYVWKCWLTLSV